jgi:hypothetical protein
MSASACRAMASKEGEILGHGRLWARAEVEEDNSLALGFLTGPVAKLRRGVH